MDPNETLRIARDAVQRLRAPTSMFDTLDATRELTDAFEALDNWLLGGGFLPDAWTRA